MIWSRYNQLDDNLKETGSDNRISENLDVEKTIAFRTVYQKEYYKSQKKTIFIDEKCISEGDTMKIKNCRWGM